VSAWRREFISLFPSLQSDAQAAANAGALMHRPLFFILKDALDQVDSGTVKKVIAYVLWLREHDTKDSLTSIEEDLLVPIVQSERLRTELFSHLSASHFEQIKPLCVLGWKGAEERAGELASLEREFRELRR
jgi:hypothetical protein